MLTINDNFHFLIFNRHISWILLKIYKILSIKVTYEKYYETYHYIYSFLMNNTSWTIMAPYIIKILFILSCNQFSLLLWQCMVIWISSFSIVKWRCRICNECFFPLQILLTVLLLQMSLDSIKYDQIMSPRHQYD